MLTPHCSAASGMVAPSSTAPITRARKSSEYGFAIHTGLLPAGSLNHIRAGMGIPLRFSLFGKRSSAANSRLLERESDPLARLRRLLKAVEFGDTATVADIRTVLGALPPPPLDQYAGHAIGKALKIVSKHD